MAKVGSMSKVVIEDYIRDKCRRKKVEAYKEFVSKLYVRNVLKGSPNHSKALRVISEDNIARHNIDFLKQLIVKHHEDLIQIVYDENPEKWSPPVKEEVDLKPNEICFNCGHKFYAENWHTPSSCPKCHRSRVD